MSSEHFTSPFIADQSSNPDNPFVAGKPSPFGSNWREALAEIKGASTGLHKVLKLVTKVARSESPVIIYGESGTGKELIARAIHRLSGRSNRRFLAINCSAIPENLLESELFGYVKGAFTGADSRRKGLFEEANGGTVFLDEIGDMPLRLQAKILRVLQEKQYSPIGSSDIKVADVRVVAATNVNLQKAVQQQNFRLDLFYRLNVFPVHVPPLRERSEDIPLLLDYFLQIANEQHVLSHPCYFTPEVFTALSRHPWPGNVRELQNLVERLVIMSGGGALRLQDLPPEYATTIPESMANIVNNTAPSVTTTQPIETVRAPAFAADMSLEMSEQSWQSLVEGLLPDTGIELTKFIEELENKLILEALERTDNNKNQAAKLLGMNRTTLVERIKKRRLAPLNSPSKEL